tara:strand:- start:67 stop:1143 length:1077 start_codon:yes stop_codon:yes gene_type:complete
MAKKSKNQGSNEAESNDIILDGIPGADQMSEEDANKEFKVDLNFEEEPKSEDDEVEFPKEGEVEEITEEELKADTEETEQDSEEEAETETAEAESEGGEAGEQEEVLADDEGDAQQSEGTVQEDVDGETQQKEPMIPKSRLDEVLAKQKALQKQLDEAKNPPKEPIEKAPEYNFDEKEQEYQNLVLEGEQEQATKLRSEIREAEKQQMMFEMQSRMGQTVQQNTEASALQAKAKELEAKYPTLDENHASFNKEKAEEVIGLRDAYMIQGWEGADALEKAVNLLMPSVEETKTDPVQKKVVEKKKVANVNKKLDAAESQPPAMKGKNKTEKKVDISNMSVDEFDALPAETLKRMRGDFG